MNKISLKLVIAAALVSSSMLGVNTAAALSVGHSPMFVDVFSDNSAVPITNINHKSVRRLGTIVGGLAVGALIGNAIAGSHRHRHHRRSRPVVVEEHIIEQDIYIERAPGHRLHPGHVDYCYTKYRSYRTYDNTFQPYGHYPRRQCISPYY